MSLELDDALAKKPTVAHWIDITRLLDETPEADLPAAVARVALWRA